MREKFEKADLAKAVSLLIGPPRTDPLFEETPSGKHNTSFFVSGWEIPVVLRIAPPDDRRRNLFYEHRMMRSEPGLHALLREKTDVPVARVVAFGQNLSPLFRDVILMERLPGAALSDVPVSRGGVRRVLRETGEALAKAHAITSELYGYRGPHEPMKPQKTWFAAFEIMWNRLLDDIKSCGGYSRGEADKMRSLLDKHRPSFDREVPASLLHMDVWGQNIMCDSEGSLTGLLDWDRSLWGDPEIEFAVLDYCGISEEPFWEGYGAQRERTGKSEIRRLFYLLYEVQKYIFIRRARYGSAEKAEPYKEQSLMLAEEIGF